MGIQKTAVCLAFTALFFSLFGQGEAFAAGIAASSPDEEAVVGAYASVFDRSGEVFLSETVKTDVVDLPGSGRVSFSLSLSGADFAGCDLFDASDRRVLTTGAYGNQDGTIRLEKTADLLGGRYRLVSRFIPRGTAMQLERFTIRLDPAGESFPEKAGETHGNSLAEAEPVYPDRPYQGQTAVNDSTDVYALSVPESGKVTIRFLAGKMTSLLTLFSEAGEEAETSLILPDADGNARRETEVYLKKGIWYLSIRGIRGYGLYSFSYRTEPSDMTFGETSAGRTPDDPIDIAWDRRIYGQLCPGENAVYYRITLPRKIRFDFTMEGTEPVCLRVEDTEGRQKLERFVTPAESGQGKASLTEICLDEGRYLFRIAGRSCRYQVLFGSDRVFADVQRTHFCHDAVYDAVRQGISDGVTKDLFMPDAPVTRAQIMTFLYKAELHPKGGAKLSFLDVKSTAFYLQPVRWAVGNGLTGGTDSRHFSPDLACTRGQLVTFLWRLAGSPDSGGKTVFRDVRPDRFYAEAAAWAYARGITGGTSRGAFRPNEPCTRGQAVTMLRAYHTAAS